MHALPCPKHVCSELQCHSLDAGAMATIHFFGKKSINYQRAMRRMDEIRITIMIIVWWYSNTFLSLPIILFSFYLLAFQCFYAVIICLPVIPWGWLHSFCVSITFHAVFIGISFTRCAWLTSLCEWLMVIVMSFYLWKLKVVGQCWFC
jgi:hypothetical protein